MKEKHKLTKPEVIARINDLLANNNQKLIKYQKNYALYNQSPMTDLRAKIPYVVGYIDDIYSDDATVPKLNVIKSAIDSVVSKISTAHCRPYVNTVKGSFKTIQVCKQLQTFLDFYYDEKGVPSKVVEALRDACIFDSGFIYFDEVTGEVMNISPWNFYTRQVEKNNFKSCYIEFPNRSIDCLSESDYDLLTKVEQKGLYATIGYFYDANSKTKATLVNRQIRDISEIKFDCVPVVPIYYTLPTVGNSTLSIADMLRGIQVEIDELMKRIAEASMLNPAQTFFLSNASQIKVGQLNNKVGNVVQFNQANTSGNGGFDVFTPNFIADQYNTLLDSLIEKAYNMVGISQLSAQGKKPAGLDSGIALATQADIESDRFQVLLDQYIKAFTDLAKLMMHMFQQDKDIVEPNRYSLRLKWGDVEKEYDKMRIQYSTADSLSKDPSTKLQQLQTLAQAGIIPATQIASLLELPDIQRGYNVANNAYSATMTLIDQVIYEDKYEIPDYVPFEMIKEQIINMELSLRSASTDGSNDEDIKKLQKYYEMIEDREAELTEQAGGMQAQANAQDVSQNNMYSAQNNVEFGNGVTDTMNSTTEGTANPYQTESEVSSQ